MSDTAVGFTILGVALLVVLGVVFAIASRRGPATTVAGPPRGVHLPSPSFLPVLMSVGGALIGSGLAFRSDDQLANPFLAIPGLFLFVGACVQWVRAAGHEWRDVEHRPHDDGTGH